MAVEIVNPGNHNQKSIVDCNPKAPQGQMNQDPPPKYCNDDGSPSKRRPDQPPLDWLKEVCDQKSGLGAHAMCDPQQTGQIVNDLANPTRKVVYNYPQSLKGTDEAMVDLFSNLVVLDNDGKAWPVPIIWGTQERAVAEILQDNIRKDDSLIVDRLKLPMMAIIDTGFQFDPKRYIYHKATDWLRHLRKDGKPGWTLPNQGRERGTIFGLPPGLPVNIGYTLTAWSLYLEDMKQIQTQVQLKFSQLAYLRVKGVQWEIGVKLDSTANNLDLEPGDLKQRVIKYQFNLTVESYIPQPVVREQAVLKIKRNVFNNVEEEKITDVLDRLETVVEDLK
jgi:hypothetical protein